MKWLILAILFLLLTGLMNRTEAFETKQTYDIVISINVHEKFNFLLKQLDNISRNVHCNYAIVLNCNDSMFDTCTKNKFTIPENVYIHPTPLNKQVFHGSILEGIYNNMCYALDHFHFQYFIVTSSRNFFENDLHLSHLNHMVQLNKPFPEPGKPWEQIQREWHWPCITDTLFTKYMRHHRHLFYKSPHEGLCFVHKDCIGLLQFLSKHADLRDELFQNACPAEEFALQTIIHSENGRFYDIGNGCCTNDRNPTNNPEKGIFKFMYKTNREDFIP